MKTRKLTKVLVFFLSVMMILSGIGLSAFAEGTANEDHTNQVRVIVENTTYKKADGAPWDGTLIDEWVTINPDKETTTDTMMSCVVAALTAKGYKQTGAESNYISEINGLSEFDGGTMSGWMGTLNDWFTSEGFNAFTVKSGKLEAGDEIKIMYTCDYGEDLSGSWTSTDKTLKNLEFSAGKLSPVFDKDTKAYTLNVPYGTTSVKVTPTASNKNYQVRTSVGETTYKRTANVPVSEGTVITVKDGDPTWPSMSDNTGEAQIYTITVHVEEPGYLSELAFGSALAKTNKGNIVLSPIFSADEHDYTLYVKDSATSLYVWSTLSEAGTGKTVSCDYTGSDGSTQSIKPTNASANGKVLTKVIAKGSTGNTIDVNVGTQKYTVNIVRTATLSKLALKDGETIINTNPTFAATTTSYGMVVPKNASLKADLTKTSDTAVVTVNGQELSDDLPLVWENNQAVLNFEVSYGSEETKTVYTLSILKNTLDGSGTQESPYLIQNEDDMVTFSKLVNNGETFSGKYFALKNDVTLPTGWTPIGDLTAAGKASYADYTNFMGTSSTPFSGIFDGEGHTITVPEGQLTAFGSVKNATLKNFNILGTKIPGYGVVQYWLRNNGSTITIENVKLLEGTHTMMSGFIGGYQSGTDRITIRNCEVEKGVVIGNDGKGFWKDYENLEAISGAYPYGPTAPIYQNDFTGSFIGAGSGEIINCKSSATVYGNNYVGGIWGMKGQSMGDCYVRESVFDGYVIANGNYAGGIIGSGYVATSAPNTPCISIQNCACYGNISGTDYVGGITSGEITLGQAWNNGLGYIQNNIFGGMISTEGTHKGAIIAYLNCIDSCNIISNNYYVEGCGVENGVIINKVETAAKYLRKDGVQAGDDPASFSVKIKTIADAIDGLNAGANSSKTWKLEEGKAVCGTDKHIISLTSTNMNGMSPKLIGTFNQYDNEAITVTYNDGSTESIKLSDCEKEDWIFNDTGYRPVKLNYQNAQMVFVLQNTEVIENEELDNAKTKAKAIIDEAVPTVSSQAVKNIAEDAKTAIDQAGSISLVTKAKENGLEAIKKQLKTEYGTITLKTDSNAVEKGQNFKVLVKYNADCACFDMNLTYDDKKAEYVGAEWGFESSETAAGPSVVVNKKDLNIYMNGTSVSTINLGEDQVMVSLTFKAIQNMDAEDFNITVKEMAVITSDGTYAHIKLVPEISNEIGEIGVYTMGDVNEDSEISIVDANTIQLYLAKYKTLSEACMKAADVYQDGKVDIKDVNRIQCYLAHLVDDLVIVVDK